jgi:hypothetical protein
MLSSIARSLRFRPILEPGKPKKAAITVADP